MSFRTRRNPAPVRASEELDPDKRCYLIWGYRTDGSFSTPFRSDAEERNVWRRYRSRILAATGQEEDGDFWGNALAFTRPWAWWRHDSPEPRRTTGRPGWGPMTRGMPRYHATAEDAEHYETERDYLTRLGLLTDAERELAGMTA